METSTPPDCGQSKPNLLERVPPCRSLSRLQDFFCISLLSHVKRVVSTSSTAFAACSKQATIRTDMLQLPRFRRIIPSSYNYVPVQYTQLPQHPPKPCYIYSNMTVVYQQADNQQLYLLNIKKTQFRILLTTHNRQPPH